MAAPPDHDPDALGPDRLLLIVVGAHLQAEQEHRPLGYRLRESIVRWQAGHPQVTPLRPVLCTDLWYLNAEDLMQRPTIAVGAPGLNAVSAFFANRLPTALVIDQSLQVQLDPEFVTLRACVWGVDERATASGIDLFETRYLDGFLRSAHDLPEAGE
ncbi:MAG: hypothetical protein IID28_13335 [Planctomycetes bacterium]|nr:hypothetical protein [Planctomycetota bacterium]